MTTIPPTAIESAKEHLIALLEDCTYARFAELGGANAVDVVRSHALSVLDALTPDEEIGTDGPLAILHRNAGCRCTVVPALTPTPAICPECEQGKCGNCDTTAWDDTLDAPTACSCTHPAVTP